MLKNTPPYAITVPRRAIKDQRVGSGPIPRKSPPYPETARIFLPLISLWNYLAHKNLWPHALGLLSLSETIHRPSPSAPLAHGIIAALSRGWGQAPPSQVRRLIFPNLVRIHKIHHPGFSLPSPLCFPQLLRLSTGPWAPLPTGLVLPLFHGYTEVSLFSLHLGKNLLNYPESPADFRPVCSDIVMLNIIRVTSWRELFPPSIVITFPCGLWRSSPTLLLCLLLFFFHRGIKIICLADSGPMFPPSLSEWLRPWHSSHFSACWLYSSP